VERRWFLDVQVMPEEALNSALKLATALQTAVRRGPSGEQLQRKATVNARQAEAAEAVKNCTAQLLQLLADGVIDRSDFKKLVAQTKKHAEILMEQEHEDSIELQVECVYGVWCIAHQYRVCVWCMVYSTSI
jgi:hypothetical protein